MSISKPPSPPLDSDRILHELEDYYQQLIEYHQKAALAAQKKLMHVKALTGDDSQSEQEENLERLPELSSLKSNPDESEESDPQNISENDSEPQSVAFFQQLTLKEQLSSKEERIQQIEEILEEDKGKAVHLDYIIRACRGIVLEQNMASARDEFRLLMKHGVSVGKWEKVPDSANCWTIRLKEMAEFSEEEEFNLRPPSMYSDLESSSSNYLPTKDVADQLGISSTTVTNYKRHHGSKLQENIHFERRGKQGVIYWTPQGVEVLRQIAQESKS